MVIHTNIKILIFRIIPKSMLSRLFGFITRVHVPAPILNRVITWYCRKFNVMPEYSVPEGGFVTFDEFFTRKLRAGARPIDHSLHAVVSPVDARIDQYGKIDMDRIIQAKGINYRVHDLIPSKTADRFIDGSFMTLYLSPADYHRIHSPVDGTVTGYFNIPGTLFTVQEFMVAALKGLFAKNERLVTYLECGAGTVAIVKVGAMNVGRISVTYDPLITNRTFRKKEEVLFRPEDRKKTGRGAEIGAFHLGSTVILLFQKNSVAFNDFYMGTRVRMGQTIGTIMS